jgi:serine protease Do
MREFVRIVALLAALSPAYAGAPLAAAQPLVQTGPLSFAPLVRRVLPAVVNISVRVSVADPASAAGVPPELKGTPLEKTFRDKLRGKRERLIGEGSGFVLDPNGTIVTNNHVVREADRIVVSFNDGTELPAHVVGSDSLTDIAVIKVDAERRLAAVPWGDSRGVQVGDWILAAGNPFGLGGSVTAGIVSGRARDIGAGPFDDFIQLDAPINPGNSGGPSFNMSGQVIGMNTLIFSPTGGSVGIGFAIPSELARRVVDELVAKGRVDRGWLGVDLDTSATKRPGAAIAGVNRGGPAARGGLHAGDLVVGINGVRVESAHELIRAVSDVTPGVTARLRVRRGAQTVELAVVVGHRPPENALTTPDP